MKLKEKYFELFKVECLKWIKIFNLNCYRVRFEFKDCKDADAQSITDSHSYVCTIALNINQNYGEFKETQSLNDYIKYLAKHECIHVLLGRISTTSSARFISKDELTEAEEELVVKLSNIIK
jgi:hypothetical protein